MDDAQIKYMADRFLGWRLPEAFNPDCGISFKRTHSEQSQWGPQKYEPTGTNLFDAQQATEMVRYIVEGMPAPTKAQLSTLIQERVQNIAASNGAYISVTRTTLRDILSREILERICDEAAEAALSRIGPKRPDA